METKTKTTETGQTTDSENSRSTPIFSPKNRFRYSDYLRKVRRSSSRLATLETLSNAPDQWYLDQLGDILIDLDSQPLSQQNAPLFDDACFLARTLWDRIAESNTRLIPHPDQDQFEATLKLLLRKLTVTLESIDDAEDALHDLTPEIQENLSTIQAKLAWRLFTLGKFPTPRRLQADYNSTAAPETKGQQSHPLKLPTREEMAKGRKSYSEVELNHPLKSTVFEEIRPQLSLTP